MAGAGRPVRGRRRRAEAAPGRPHPGPGRPAQPVQRPGQRHLPARSTRPTRPGGCALAAAARSPALDGVGTTRLGGLLSRRLAARRPARRSGQDQLRRTRLVRRRPGRAHLGVRPALAATVATLKATSGLSGDRDDSLKWETQLDTRAARRPRPRSTPRPRRRPCCSIAVLAGAVLVLLLAADLLVRRRAAALTAARQRGAALPDLGRRTAASSRSRWPLPAAALGLALASPLAGGAALLVGRPGRRCARSSPARPSAPSPPPAATRDRRAPANRAARRWAQRTAPAAPRRARRRRPAASRPAPSSRCASAASSAGPRHRRCRRSAPTLGALAGALLLLRLLPAGTGLALRQALRSRRPLAVFGAAQAAATAARVLPLLVLTTHDALASFAVTLGRRPPRRPGRRRVAAPSAPTPASTSRPRPTGSTAALAAPASPPRPGVDHAVAGEVDRPAPGSSPTTPRPRPAWWSSTPPRSSGCSPTPRCRTRPAWPGSGTARPWSAAVCGPGSRLQLCVAGTTRATPRTAAPAASRSRSPRSAPPRPSTAPPTVIVVLAAAGAALHARTRSG